MTAPIPEISIIIPSHNRRDLLGQVLDALAHQDAGTPPFEVIVVADGCRDGTVEMLRGASLPFPLCVCELPGVGPSVARNSGAQQALAPFLLFIDDDVIPTSAMVRAHVQAHEEDEERAVVGPYPPAPHVSRELFRLNARRWWHAHFDAQARPGHRFCHTDLLTGNLSMRRQTWDRVGGLDPQFARAREDLELGVRLLKEGVRIFRAEKAVGWHQEYLTTSPDSALRRAKEEGRSDLLMALKHPEMRERLDVTRFFRSRRRTMRGKIAVYRRTGAFDTVVTRRGPALLRLLEKAGLMKLRRRVEHSLREYCYLRGGIEAVGTQLAAIRRLPPITAPQPELVIDLAQGFEQAEAQLTQTRPAVARIVMGPEEIGTLPWSPTSEPWHGRHLRPYLARHCSRQLAPSLAAARFGGPVDTWRKVEAFSKMGVKDYWVQSQEARRQFRDPSPADVSAPPVPRGWLARTLGHGVATDKQASHDSEMQAVARGYLLLFVFYIHALIGVSMMMGDKAWYSLIQLKLLAPGVSIFFLLSGMAAPGIAEKGVSPMLRQSLVLLLLATLSHAIGFLILLIGQGYPNSWEAAKALIKPIVYGTNYTSFVAWFFVVLAAARMYAYAFLRSKIVFALLVAATIAAVWLTQAVGLPDNIYEWRNWPTATLFFLVGMRFPSGRKIPNWVGMSALLMTTVLVWINRHGLYRQGPCLDCDLHFVAQPMIGQYGSIFVYVLQQILLGIFVVWIAHKSAKTVFGRTARFFGDASLSILLLHGWVLLTLYPPLLTAMPVRETAFTFIAIMSSAIVVHAALYAFLARPLTTLQVAVFKLSYLGTAEGRMGRRRRR